jgi:hypothetical protein
VSVSVFVCVFIVDYPTLFPSILFCVCGFYLSKELWSVVTFCRVPPWDRDTGVPSKK